MLHKPELSALLTLLDDKDQEVFEHVFEKLLSYGPGIIPSLEVAWNGSQDAIMHSRLQELIQRIQFESLLNDFKIWSHSAHKDLLTGACLVAKYYHPDLKLHEIERQVDEIRKAVWIELSYNLTPIEQVNIFNKVLFEHLDFQCDTNDQADEDSYLVNQLLNRKNGNAVAMGVLYLVLAELLEMPIYGISLPGQFVLAFAENRMDFEREGVKPPVLFYINPNNSGLIFTRSEIKDYLGKLSIEPQPNHFQPIPSNEIVIELINSLIEVSKQNGDKQAEGDMRELLDSL